MHAGCRAEALRRACEETVRILRRRGVDPALAHADLRITVLAGLQDGIVVWDQLLTLGVGRGQIARRAKRGALNALHVGVYLWARSEPTFEGRVRAAVLASGAAAASHDASLALVGVRPVPGGPIDVTAVGRRPRGRGIRGHEVATLHDDDITTVSSVAITSPARALLEVAAYLPALQLADAVELAQVKKLVTKTELASALARAPGRPGCAVLRALVEEPAFTRSRAERRLVALLRAAHLPEPIFNADVDGWEVDAVWPRHRVALEFDSYTFHATRAAFERDRRKGAALTRSRHLVLRTTWTELTKQSHALVARLAEALARGAGPTATAEV
jgi:very-short-patch-repair endonuclease